MILLLGSHLSGCIVVNKIPVDNCKCVVSEYGCVKICKKESN